MRAALVLALALVALLTGCGGNGEGDEEPLALDTTATAPVAETVLEMETETETMAAQAAPAAPQRIAVPDRRPLGPGNQGRPVVELQRALAALGFDAGTPDGIYGDQTRRAVIAFQREHQLAADGLVGARTARAINAALADLTE